MRLATLLLPVVVACGTPAPPDAGSAPVDAGVTDASQGDATVVLTVRRLVTLGSSSTAGAGASAEDRRYVNLVANALGAELVNLGSSGQTVNQVQATYLARALDALDAGPPPEGTVDVVTLLPFTDFAQRSGAEIAAGYDPILGSLEATGAFVVFGVPSIDARYACGTRGDLRGPDGECYDPALVDTYAARAEAVREMIATHPLTSVADIPQQQAQHPDWQRPDGHPNDLGHQDLAERFLAAIRARLTTTR